MSVFFVAGVHGVGKTTACAEVALAVGIGHHTASQIIRSARTSAISNGTKFVADVEENQRLLIEGVRRLLDDGQQFLLDGHFTLQTAAGIRTIPVQIFEHLHIQGVIIFSDAPETIVARAQTRDGHAPSIDEVRLHQEAEIRHARLVTANMNIPLVSLTAFDAEGLRNAILEWL